MIEVYVADYHNSDDRIAIIEALDAYAQDPMGGGKALAEDIKASLIDNLLEFGKAFSILVKVDGKLAGLANCIEGFSTFKNKPLVNIHDLVVLAEFRGLKLSHRLLDKVAEVAKARGCCKLTLEVLSGNEAAKQSYLNFGFAGYELDPESGQALFWDMLLED